MKTPTSAVWKCVAVLLFCAVIAPAEPLRRSAEVKALFRKPTRHYSNGPLWVWNDRLTDDQIRSTLRDLAGQNVKQVWVHPRPGLMTPYLSEEWFRLWRLALKEAERLDMNVWIYDENSYPSGFAGGFVPELMPESRGRGLQFRQESSSPPWTAEIVGVYLAKDGTHENVTARVRNGEKLTGSCLVVREVRDQNSPWHGNRSYVNLLSPGVTEKFLEVTLEPYREHFGRSFGKRIPGVFTDEPNIRPVGDLPWSEVLAQEFQKRWGYSLLDHLPSLITQSGDWRRVRHNYFQVLHEQFVERWAKPYFEYCEKYGLEFTGHYWDHEWPNCIGVPDNMAMYAWHQRPAIDCLMNQYREDTHAQFGNVRMVRELSSVANQLGIQRTLCEVYGAGGWDLRFEDMKRIGDWLQVLGVNTLNEHLSYVTIRGARKRDHPQSFSYHTPWWPDYNVMADYFARLSAALSQGEQVNRVLVLEPTTTAWMYQRESQSLQQLGQGFVKLLMALEAAQVEYDLVSEDILARHGQVEGQKLRVGKRVYEQLVIPPYTENLNSATSRLLERVPKLYLGSVPARVDGSGPAPPPMAEPIDDLIQTRVAELQKAQRESGTFVDRSPGDGGILFHHRRQLADGELLFLVNTSMENRSAGVVVSDLAGVEEWDLFDGKTKVFPHAKIENGVSARFDLPPSGSLLLLLTGKSVKSDSTAHASRTIASGSEPQIRRIAPNVLTLDYVDVRVAGESRTNVYFYQANQLVFQKNGMERNPWDSAVQFKNELIRRQFPKESGFEADYRFTIQGPVPESLELVLECPDLYRVLCNGNPLKQGRGWWLDKAFGRLDLSKAARTGENVITIKASPFTISHELEPAYLLGEFSLEPAEDGFIIVPPVQVRLGEAQKLRRHTINPDGTMWLSTGVGFKEDSQPDDPAPFLVFDLGRSRPISTIRIWNYNEGHVRDLTTRGAHRIRLSETESSGLQKSLGEFELTKADLSGLGYTTLKIESTARFIRVDFLSNHQGVSFPAQGQPEDHGFVGLAKVEFLGPEGTLSGVTVARASSELTKHSRLAANLVNGKGLDWVREGWDRQGMPFYAEGVCYEQEFVLKERSGTYAVKLGEWLGSLARVRVNGTDAGRIVAPPWECDVTEYLAKGSNKIEVTVVGTLKNTLGPHHGNPPLGAAWPSGFHKAPASQPPGQSYHTISYGLFEPFTLRQVKEGPLEISQ